jgi:tetratricopeptide (TPR) repeat protein
MNESDGFQKRTEKEIFFEALDKQTPEERAAFLDGACGKDSALRARVEALLTNHYQEDAFMKKPAVEGEIPTIRISPIPEAVGTVIGRYKLLQQIGEGGCGVVYVAEQEQPVRRRVALKVIKLGMDTRQVIARFEAERQALALMDHPNIAKVFDAGATEKGRPFFVMELVKGISLTRYCDENKLNTQKRLNLFIQVCQAIQHAHQKGIIHRDIKPSNVLVADHDGVAVPKVIDFGIAKATTDQRLTDKTLYTAMEQFIGTPAYMSPEQAQLSGLDVDTRADIYSLGVLLYELLTGRTPFEPRRLLELGLDEIRRIIREEEPLRPSTRLQTLDAAEQTKVAIHRNSEPPKLLGILRGDLDWIVMKALEKDRKRRYETANGLALDVERHLQNELVMARPPSVGYRFQKMARRHRLAFTTTACVLATLVIGLGLSTWEFVEKGRAYQRAVAAEEAAEKAQANEVRLRQQAEIDKKTALVESERSKQVSRFLEEMLEGVGPSVALGRDTTILQEILDKAAKRVGTELTDQPLNEMELLTTIGWVYNDLHQYDKAESLERKALDIGRQMPGSESPEVALLLRRLAWTLLQEHKLTEAETMARESVGINKELHANQNMELARSLDGLAVVLDTTGRLGEAETMYREALAMERKSNGNDDPQVASTLNNLAVVLSKQRKWADAETAFREALELYRKTLGNQHPYAASSLGGLADVLREQGKWAEAEPLYREALAIRRKLFRSDDGEVIAAANDLADDLFAEHKYDEAENELKELNDAQSTNVAGQPHNVDFLRSRAYFDAQHGRFTEAIATVRQAIAINPADHELWHWLAALLVQTGQIDAYRENCRQSLERFGETTDPFTAVRIAKDCLILPGSRTNLDTVSALVETAVTQGQNTWGLPYFQFSKGLAEYRQNRFASATNWVGLALTNGDVNSSLGIEAYMVLAMSQNHLGQSAQARASLAKGGEIEQKLPKLESGDLGAGWMDWIIAHALMTEATALIESNAKASGRPK